MSPSLIALSIALFLIITLVVGLAILSLLFGTFETLFGKPKLTLLRAINNGNSLAFGFQWNQGKEPAAIDGVRIRLFNPFGTPTQVDISKIFEVQKSSFAMEVDMGPEFIELLGAQNLDVASVEIQIFSRKDGICFTFEMKGTEFKKLIFKANQTVVEFIAQNKIGLKPAKLLNEIPIRTFIADTVPGRGAHLKIATNPEFAGGFTASSAHAPAAKGSAEPAVDNFAVARVWIEPGCIVCDACADIYPEVFEVLPDTCIIRPNAPLDDGLRIQEAAEACPVEVIKFTKA
jgi:ferredoxin